MKDASPTFAQIKAQVAAIRKKIPGTKSIAIRSKAKWSGNSSYEDNGEVFQIHQCDSPLAMRLALRESSDEKTTVLVTDLDDHDISDDILVRLKPRKLIPLDSWQIVKALFQVRAVEPLAQRLHVDFTTDAKYDNPRAIQIRLPAFDLDRLCLVGTRVRDIYLQHAKSSSRIAARCDDQYVRVLAEAVTGKLGGKIGVAPRIFLKKLVADVLDRVDLHESFDPRVDYQLTIGDVELTTTERHAMAGTSVDEIELEL